MKLIKWVKIKWKENLEIFKVMNNANVSKQANYDKNPTMLHLYLF